VRAALPRQVLQIDVSGLVLRRNVDTIFTIWGSSHVQHAVGLIQHQVRDLLQVDAPVFRGFVQAPAWQLPRPPRGPARAADPFGSASIHALVRKQNRQSRERSLRHLGEHTHTGPGRCSGLAGCLKELSGGRGEGGLAALTLLMRAARPNLMASS